MKNFLLIVSFFGSASMYASQDEKAGRGLFYKEILANQAKKANEATEIVSVADRYELVRGKNGQHEVVIPARKFEDYGFIPGVKPRISYEDIIEEGKKLDQKRRRGNQLDENKAKFLKNLIVPIFSTRVTVPKNYTFVLGEDGEPIVIIPKRKGFERRTKRRTPNNLVLKNNIKKRLF